MPEQSSLCLIQAGANDIDLLITMMRQFYLLEQIPFQEDIARSALTTLVKDPALGWITLPMLEDTPAGYAVITYGFSLEFHGRFALLDELFIRAEYRGKGIGKQILQSLIQRCRGRGIAALRLEVDHENPRAQALYQKSGFQAHQRAIMTLWLQNEQS